MGTHSLTTDWRDASQKSVKTVDPFALALDRHGIELKRGKTTILQVNVGLLCNLTCKHCHLEAGPHRKEVMDRETMEQVALFAARGSFEVVDITGGAPELNPRITTFIERVAGIDKKVMFRSNLSTLTEERHHALLQSCYRHRVVIVGSLPSLNTSQLESQRGAGVLEKSTAALKRLNSMGYGRSGTGLQLDLVCNPTGAFLPPSQKQTESKFRIDLERKWGIVFNNLYTFANVPLGRFRQWLLSSGNLEKYMQKLVSSFNPCTLRDVMCQKLVSVSWDGYLYDCDFNLAVGMPLGGVKTHVSTMTGSPSAGTPIAVSDHCYACTAGTGFT